MAIALPRLDDRTYEQLAEAMRRQLPLDEWTDHNPSDPGIALIELFAWMGEMLLWRIDRVPSSHTRKFLDFLLDPPAPVTVVHVFEATFNAGSPATFTIPAGTRVATDFAAGRRFVFETYQPLVLKRPDPLLPQVDKRPIRARAIREIEREPLGVSDGSAHQIFQLRAPRQALGLDQDAPAPVLTDYVHRSATYDPNPRVTVGGVAWKAVPSLLTPESLITAPDLGRRYQVNATDATVRFGDDTFGAVPALNALIECERYSILDDTAALKVRSGDVKHLLNLAVPATIALTISNLDAEGGDNFFPLSTRTVSGLAAFRAPYRLVTERDFERAVLVDFNDFQRLAGATPQILRASIAIDQRPSVPGGTAELLDAPSFVSFVLLPGLPQFDEAQFRNEAVPVPTKQLMVDLPDATWQRLRRFLDPRRLITTRLERHTPLLKAFGMTATIVVAGDRSVSQLEADLRERVFDFLSLVGGDVHGRGWRLGRNVYRAHLFRLLEDVDGVDHVESLALSPADADGNVPVAPHELPLLQTLSLTVVRG
jgi:hypothetical protein